MPLLSILTAATGDRATYVREAGISLANQELPSGWEFEWLVQEDGPAPALADMISEFPFARHKANMRQLGPADTRNLALRHASGELIHVLDCDDLQLPDGLAQAVNALHTYPDIHWVTGQADDLLECGTRIAFAPLVKPGYIPAGELNEFFLTEMRWPIMSASITARTASIQALGGWPGATSGEDILLHIALAELTPGYHLPETTWLYRRHEQQITRDPYLISRWDDTKEMGLQRIKTMRQLKLQFATQNDHGPSITSTPTKIFENNYGSEPASQ